MRTAPQSGLGAGSVLSEPFVAIPYAWFQGFSELGLRPVDVVVLLQIVAACQVEGRDFLSPFDLSRLCGMSPDEVSEVMSRLIQRGLLRIDERVREDGTHSTRFDLSALSTAFQPTDHQPEADVRQDPVTLFESEFGRPLSAIECEQIRHWLEKDQYPEWLVIEALREAVLANKFSFKYIDRILYDWQRNQVRTRQELEMYRQQYRERTRAKEEAAATGGRRPRRTPAGSLPANSPAGQGNSMPRDERYSAFYELFPDA